MTTAFIVLLSFSCHAFSEEKIDIVNLSSTTENYSQDILLKNWSLSTCLATIAVNEQERDDANATASAYLEFGHQDIEAYDQLRELVKKYANAKYGSSIGSDLKTMKCIDLYHSKHLEKLVNKILHTH